MKKRTLAQLDIRAMDEDIAASQKHGTTVVAAQPRFLCHADGTACPDGCDTSPDPARLEVFNEL